MQRLILSPKYYRKRVIILRVDMNKVEMLAKLEKVLEVPTSQQLTRWYGDYGIYEAKLDVTQEDIDKRIEELLGQIEHNTSIVIEIRETLSRKITIENPQNIREAVDTVMERYYNEKIVLDADDFQRVEFLPVEDMEFEIGSL